jgi:hypothetical protein
MADDDAGFLSRWSRRKALAREGQPLPQATPDPRPQPPLPPTPTAGAATAVPLPAEAGAAPAAEAPPAPTLEEAQSLTPDSDFRRFVAPEVTPQVRNAALKRLFTDPQFNVMDGLDIYIDDYGRPDPLPAGMLRKMTQSAFLNLFADDPTPAPDPTAALDTPAAPAETPPDEDPDLRLQPHDAAGPPGPGPGPGQDPGGER